MPLFSKTPKGDDARRLPDEPLGGQWAKSLPLLHRIVIHVLVSEIRQMLDERDAEREAREERSRRVYGAVGLDLSAQRAETDRGEE